MGRKEIKTKVFLQWKQAQRLKNELPRNLFPLHAQAPIYKPPSVTLPPRSARRVDVNIKQPKRWPTAGTCHLEPVLSLCSFSSSSLITFQESRLLHWMWFWWAGRLRCRAPTVGSGGESLPTQSQYREDMGLGLCWASWEHPPWQHTRQDGDRFFTATMKICSSSDWLIWWVWIYSFLLILWASDVFPIHISFLLN